MRVLGARMVAQNGYRNLLGWQLCDTTGSTESWSYNATGASGTRSRSGRGSSDRRSSRSWTSTLTPARDEAAEAFLIALENAADSRRHSVITGTARGATLRLSKTFDTATSGSARSATASCRRSSCRPAGIRWHVESVDAALGQGAGQDRALPADMRAACRERSGVRAVAVDRGKTKRLRLEACMRRLKG